MTAPSSSPLARPTLSACLIVKNEAKNLPRCLASLKGVVDEIVVVDTGSTDETVRIAESYGAKVGHFAWIDDFSAARNESLRLATGDWALVIDADEELVVQDLGALHALMLGSRQTAYAVRLANLDDKDLPQDNVQVLRLFPRVSGVRFTGRLHEAIDRSLEQLGGWRVEETAAIRLLHRGYQTEAVLAMGKPERNLRLAQREAEEHPESSYAWFNLCRSFIYADQLTEALRAYHHLLGIKARGAGDTFVDRYLAMADQQCQASLVKIPDAEAQLREAMELLPEDFEPTHRLMGIYRAQQQDVAGALPYLTRAQALNPAIAETYYWLGFCAVQQERFEDAWTLWERCLELQPDHDAARQGVAVLNRSRTALMSVSTPVAAKAPLISACLIVKDEAKSLPRCLASLKGLVDEIVVVDTGSTDETVQIAESYGAKIGHFTWVDDFSAARNASLELATGDWVLVIDADEELVAPDREAFFQDLAGGSARAYVMDYHNVGGDGRVASRYVVSPRLFRRYPGVKFSGRLHEDIRPFLKQVGWEPVPLRSAYLLHHGYTPERVAEKDKLARNFQLAQRMTEEQPKEPTPWYFLASAAWLMKDLDAAQHGLDQVRRLRDYGREVEPALRPAVALLQAGVHEAAGRAEEARAALEDGLTRFPGHPELHYELGKRRLEAGDMTGARADFEACLAAGRTGGWSNLRSGVTGYLVQMELGSMDLTAGRSEDAYAHFAAAAVDPDCPAEEAGRLRQVLEVLPTTTAAPTPQPPAISAPSTLEPVADRVAAGDFEGAIALLLAYLQANPRSAAGFLALAKVHHALGNLDKALLSVGESLKLDAGSSAGYHLLGLVLEALGQPGYAEKAFAVTLSLDPDHPSARESRLAVRNRQPEFELPPEQAEAIAGLLKLANPTVSACLIVKNEAKNLARCLESLKGVVDEIVVVDTGSTDETVAIAESFGAKIGHFAWVDDFSAARNVSLELATGDWILVIDADEEIVLDDPEAFRRALQTREPGAYMIRQESLDDAGQVAYDAPMLRLFQRHPQVRYRGRLHEGVDASLKALGWPVYACEALWMKHHGYVSETFLSLDKAQRNLRLAMREVEDHPEEAQAWLHLARSYMLSGQHAEALETFRRLAALPDAMASMSDGLWTHYLFLQQEAHQQLGDPQAAEALLNEGLARVPDLPEFLYERGRLRVILGRPAEAMRDFAAALQAPPRRPGFMALPGRTDTLPRQALQQLAQAEPALREAIATLLGAPPPPVAAPLPAPAAPAELPPLRAAVKGLRGGFEPTTWPDAISTGASPVAAPLEARRAELLARLAQHPREAVSYLEVALLLYQEQAFDKALLALGEALKLNAGSAAGYHLLGMILEALGQPGYAEKAFAVTLSLDPDHLTARESRLAVRNRQPEFELPPEQAEAIEGLLKRVNPTVSACLIVKNEAENLPRCLESLKGLVDEIIVVDTGSTDETVKIAESYGAKIGHFAWVDDFSAARNASLELATGDWVLVIDADETLVVADHEALAHALRDRQNAGYILYQNHVDREGRTEAATLALRLFQRHPEVRFAGRIHETVNLATAALGWPTPVVEFVSLSHIGHWNEFVTEKSKPARNVAIAELEAQDHPEEPSVWVNLARSYAMNGQWQEALATFERVAAMPQGEAGLADLFWTYYVQSFKDVYVHLERFEEAERLLDRALERLPCFPDFLFERSKLRFHRGDVEGAIADLAACLAARERPFNLKIQEGVTDVRPRQALAEIAAMRPEWKDRIEAVLRDEPTPRASAESRKDALLKHLGEQPRDASGFLELGLLFYQDGHFDKALLSLGESLKLDAGNAASYHLLGLVLQQLGQPGYAEKAFAVTLSLDPDHLTARESRLAVRNRQPEFALPPEQAEAIEGLLKRVNPTVSACLIVKNEAENLPRCLESLKGVVDEIVVVDTGSADETVKIAESFGAKIGHFAWVDDFSAARNASLELATGDWILVVDADEEVVLEDHEAFTRALRDRRPAGYVTPLMNVNDEGREESSAPMMRLFQRHPRIRFTGRLHEQLGPAFDALGWPVSELSGVRLRHYGYQTAMIASRQKAERNIKLSLAQTQDEPGDPYAWLHLARSYRLNQQVPEALAAYEQIQRLPEGDRALVDFVYATYVNGLQEVYQQVGRLPDAAQLLTEGLGRLPGFPEFHFERGRVRFRLGDVSGARADFEACLAAEGRTFHAVMREGITSTLPRQALAELAMAGQAQPLRLSASLIVKNEAKNLARCLESLKGVVDEIVVVDTGSTDETVAIAESFGAKIGHFAWIDDFSAARNASLELATGDWVLVIDADEELSVTDYEALRTGLLDPAVGGYVIDQLNVDDHGRFEPNPVTRLFRRRPEVRYVGRLHEDVTVSILELGFAVRPLGAIALRHAGYTKEAVEAGGKWERNLKLSLLDVEQHQASPDAWYNLGRSTLFLAQPDRALEAFGQVLRLLEDGGVMAEGRFVNFVLLYQRLLAEHGRSEEALRVLSVGLSWLPAHPDFTAAQERLLASQR